MCDPSLSLRQYLLFLFSDHAPYLTLYENLPQPYSDKKIFRLKKYIKNENQNIKTKQQKHYAFHIAKFRNNWFVILFYNKLGSPSTDNMS